MLLNQKQSAQEFNEKFFRGSGKKFGTEKITFKDKGKWFGRKGIIEIDKDRFAEIILDTHGYADNYEGYTVQIVHKTNGVIVTNYFYFKDYLKKRCDNRNDYNGKFYVWHNNDNFDWYIAIPSNSEIDNMIKEIFSFIEVCS